MRIPALAILVAVGFLLACEKGDGQPASAVTGIVLVSIDTLRPDHLPAYGYPRDTAPFLSEMAQRGVVFEQAIAQSPWTVPSHGTLLTSLYPSILGLGTWKQPRRLPQEATTLAEVLRAAGFRTRALAGGGFVSEKLGFDRGFERFEGSDRALPSAVDLAIAWIGGLGSEERFFLFLHTFQVHNYAPSPEARRRFVRPYAGRLLGVSSLPALLEFPSTWRQAFQRLHEDDLRYVVDLYDAAIHSVDLALRGLYARLWALGRGEDTLLVVTSDHGEEFLDHGATGHGWTLYEENLRVPLIFQHASLSPRRLSATVRTLDVAPTLVELAGLEPPATWQGTSLLPRMRDGAEQALPAFSEHAHVPLRSLRRRSLKYVESLNEGGAELYDLDLDPHERRNLVGSGLPAEGALQAALRQWADANAAAALRPGAEALDDEMRAQLEALGYVEPRAGDTPAGRE